MRMLVPLLLERDAAELAVQLVHALVDRRRVLLLASVRVEAHVGDRAAATLLHLLELLEAAAKLLGEAVRARLR